MTSPAPLRILIVDDHLLLAQSLAVALEMRGVRAAIADLSSRDRVIEQIHDTRPDLVILDLDLGGAIGDGGSLVSGILLAGSRALLLSAATDQSRWAGAIELGAVGMVNKAAPFEELLGTVMRAARGEQVMSEAERRTLVDDLRRSRAQRRSDYAPFERLTTREKQVLVALSSGQNVSQIAATAYVSEATVRSQVRSILAKLEVNSQLEAVACAARVGWLTGSR